MDPEWQDPAIIDQICESSRRIAIVGISNKPDRPSYEVALYLKKFVEIVPVNPALASFEGAPCYPSLREIPKSLAIDTVNIFRRSETVLPVVEEAIAIGARFIWMQQAVINEPAALLARDAGLKVVMDACLAVAYSIRRKT